MCKCQTCLELINKPSAQNTYIEFQKELEEGRIRHIGTTDDGRPIYVWSGH
jgi:hypothetical protein